MRTREDDPPLHCGEPLEAGRGGEVRFGFRDLRSAGAGTATADVDALMRAASQITTMATGGGLRPRGGHRAAVFPTLLEDAPVEARPMLTRLKQLAPALLAKEASLV